MESNGRRSSSSIPNERSPGARDDEFVFRTNLIFRPTGGQTDCARFDKLRSNSYSAAVHARGRRRPFLLAVLFLMIAIARTAGATQAAYIEDEAPPPTSAKEIEGAPEPVARPREIGPSRFPRIRKYLDTLPPFWRDTRLVLKPRLYNFDRDRGEAPDQVTFAAGAAIEYRSGLWRDRLAVGLTAYTTQKLHGPRDAGGLGLLRPTQTGFGVLGQAYARIDLRPIAELRLYRQGLHLPYLNRQDSRMIPTTHEAYLIGQPEERTLEWVAGHVTRMKSRNADRFIPLSEAAGFANTDEGASLAGLRWRFDDGTTVGIYSLQAWDFMNITYAEGHTVFDFAGEIHLALSAQATYQVSTGDEFDGDFGTYTAGARAAISYRYAVLSIAGTYTDEDDRIRSPFGGRPGYLSLMLADFDRAGEAAWLIALSYNFGRFGIDGLSFNLKYARGYGDAGAPDRDEFDMTVDFKPERTFVQGLWLRLRYATLDTFDGRSRDDTRIIVNYEIPLL